jgi:hypothetical protein
MFVSPVAVEQQPWNPRSDTVQGGERTGEGQMRSRILLFTLLLLQGCAISPDYLGGTDQILGLGPSNASVIKSLRCEIITFLVENKLRAQLWHDALPKLKAERKTNLQQYQSDTDYLRQTYPFIDIDSNQYASLQGDFKNIDLYTATLGVDWKYVLSPVISNDYHLGPSFTQTRTFESIQPIAVPQNGDLGASSSILDPGDPLPPKAVVYTTLYNRHPVEDEHFYCYASFYNSPSTSLENAIDDVHRLLIDDPAAEQKNLIHFKRIHVDGITLAKWLQDQTASMSAEYRTFQNTGEAALPGQLEYAFTLDIKPSLDLKFTRTTAVLTPLAPELSGSLEHSTQFTLYINTEYSTASLSAKTGSSCNGKVKNGVCIPNKGGFVVGH